MNQITLFVGAATMIAIGMISTSNGGGDGRLSWVDRHHFGVKK